MLNVKTSLWIRSKTDVSSNAAADERLDPHQQSKANLGQDVED